MRNTFLRFTLLGLASASLLSACADSSSDDGAVVTTTDDGTSIIRPKTGALTAPSSAARSEIVRDFLNGRGVSGADHLTVISEGAGRGGITHVKLEQVVDGLRVHDAYVKAAIDQQGQLLQVIEKVATPTTTAKPAVNERAALAATLAHLRYDGAVPVQVAAQGNKTRFFKATDFYKGPNVERVAYVDSNGSLAQGFLVETWFDDGNQLDYTLVDGSGGVVSSERRTNNDSYNVYAEDPGKGAQTVLAGPGSGNAESPSGWLGAGSQTTINITGNNVHGYLDAKPNNAPDTGGTSVTTGNFLTVRAAGEQPSSTTNKAVAVQNLFYLNNVVHDILYRHGFNEAAGNFQENNFGNGGAGSDSVNAEAQDGGGTDNANFATPSDGGNPRMQMYLWSASGGDSQVVTSGGTYLAYQSSFGTSLTTSGTAQYALAVYADASTATDTAGVVGTFTDACQPSTVSLSNKIAIVDRGGCSFILKVQNAAAAGAKGVIIANNVGTSEAFAAGGSGRVRIPSVMVGKDDGAALKSQTAARLRKNPVAPLMVDGDLDSDIVFHEYGHGLTWRMIGSMSGAMPGAIGEGAADTLAFLINGDDRIGEYAYSNPLGIRRNPYTNYPLTYADFTGAEVHNDGEIFAAIMWRLYELYGQDGEAVLSVFVDGMNFTPASPKFEDMRNGMVQSLTVSGGDACPVWRAFAAFGVGVGASGSTSPPTTSSTVPPGC